MSAFALWQSELLGTLYYLVGNVEDARDAVQDAFIKCWKHRDEVAAIENLKAWIFQVAMNTGRDLRGTAWRRRRESLENVDPMMPGNDGNPLLEAQNREEAALLRQAIANLRAEEQEVFLLRQNADLTYEEIGASLGIAVGTVKTRMRMALQKLRLAFEKN